MKRCGLLAEVLGFCLFGATPAAAVPQGLIYTARLGDATGRPIEGPIEVSISFYTSATGGTLLAGGSKKPLGGGCILMVDVSARALHDTYPTASGWACIWNGTMTTARAWAICANIR